MERRKTLIAVLVVIFGSLAMALVTTALVWLHKSKKTDNGEVSVSVIEKQDGSVQNTQQSRWQLIKSTKSAASQGPSITGFIKAGDETLYSSALFDRISLDNGDTFLETVYREFAEVLGTRPTKEMAKYSSAISKFMPHSLSNIRPTPSIRRAPSIRRSVDLKGLNALDHSPNATDTTLSRSKSKRQNGSLVSCFNPLPFKDASDITQPVNASWTYDVQDLSTREGHLAITVSRVELLALFNSLGIHFSIRSPSLSNQSQHPTTCEVLSITGTGAFGTTIEGSILQDGTCEVQIRQQKRPLVERSSRGSGFSTLHAKYMGSGALPFEQDATAVHAILITDETRNIIKSGTALELQKSTTPLEHISRFSELPALKPSTFHTLVAQPSSAPAPSLSLSPTPSHNFVNSTLLHAISNLPFTAGLVPLAPQPLVSTITFLASAGLTPGLLLQRLEDLIHKVHRQAPHLRLFGPIMEETNVRSWWRERRMLGAVRGPDMERKWKSHKKADIDEVLSTSRSVARTGRYTVLLERLMALLVAETRQTPERVKELVIQATILEMQCSWVNAIAAEKGEIVRETPTPVSRTSLDSGPSGNMLAPHIALPPSPTPTPPHSPISTPLPRHAPSNASRASQSSEYTSATSRLSPTRASGVGKRCMDLGRQVEEVLKLPLPLNIRNVAKVARLVVVAWTLGVGVVDEGDLDVERLPESVLLF